MIGNSPLFNKTTLVRCPECGRQFKTPRDKNFTCPYCGKFIERIIIEKEENEVCI